ncbi:MAG: sugar phosphate isomerase/epimerase [Methanobrevibacter sp.]|jgi:sugar phosphate isomerase/epimerase|nr:sugar phosphate isomerase/epimerase [Candidatus Methanovirga australis]
MKIGVSSLTVYDGDIIKSLEFVENLNIKYFELSTEYPNNRLDRELLKSFNLKYSIHSPTTDINLASLNRTIQKASIQEIKNSIEIANDLDADIVVVHPGGFSFLGEPCEKKILNRSKESLKACRDYGRELGVTPVIENMPNHEGFIYKDVHELNDLLTDLEMKMALDIGHAFTNGFKEEELYFDLVSHVHLSDNFGDKDLHLALGKGKIDFKKIVDNFKGKNYDGVFILEIGDKNEILNNMDYLSKLFHNDYNIFK